MLANDHSETDLHIFFLAYMAILYKLFTVDVVKKMAKDPTLLKSKRTRHMSQL